MRGGDRALDLIADRAVRGVLVPEGMVAVNPDDLKAALRLILCAPGASLTNDQYERLMHAAGLIAAPDLLAASNPTTETKP
jgi:hypothetical protein